MEQRAGSVKSIQAWLTGRPSSSILPQSSGSFRCDAKTCYSSWEWGAFLQTHSRGRVSCSMSSSASYLWLQRIHGHQVALGGHIKCPAPTWRSSCFLFYWILGNTVSGRPSYLKEWLFLTSAEISPHNNVNLINVVNRNVMQQNSIYFLST